MAGKASSFFKLIDLMLKGAGKVIDDIISVFAKKASEVEPVDEKSSVSDIRKTSEKGAIILKNPSMTRFSIIWKN